MADEWDIDAPAAPASSWGEPKSVKAPGGRGRGFSTGLSNQMNNLKVSNDESWGLSKLPHEQSMGPTNPDPNSSWAQNTSNKWGSSNQTSGATGGSGWKSAAAASNGDDDWGDGPPGQFADAQEQPSSGGWGSTASQKPASSTGWGGDNDDQPRGGGWGSSNGGGRGGRGPSNQGGGGWSGASHGGGERSMKCHNCNEEGHMSRECPQPKTGGRSGSCYNCGQEGHMSRDCPTPKDGGNRNRGCRNCGEEGHMARDCPNKDNGGGGSGGGGSRACYNCGQEGHQSRDCDQPRKPREGGGGGGACFKCQSTDHMAKDCPQGDVGPDGKQREVYIPEDIQDENELFRNGISTGNNFANFDNIALQVTGNNVPNYITSFETAGLRELVLQNIKNSGYTKPTPVQKGSIAVILARRDLIASAVTGSGKTAAYLIPVINILLEKQVQGASHAMTQKPEVVIISPTRELAIQIHREARKFAHNSVLKSVILYGGTQVSHQRNTITSGCNILVATPGRLKDFVDKEIVDFSNVQFFILDEADRMLDMGFGPEIEKIASHPSMPPVGKRITLMFSATFPREVQGLAQNYLHDYVFVTTGTIGGTNPDVCQDFHEVNRSEKRNKLVEILRDLGSSRVIVFVESKKTADFIAAFLANNQFQATSIHGDRLQSQRETALREFKSGIRNILVATNVAARGLDIAGVECVINYDLPNDIEEYVHRIGRTGRVGNVGRSISFYDPDRDSDKAGALVAKLSASQADVPSFLQSAISGIGGMGYNFNAPSSSASGFRSVDARRFGNSAGFVDKPVETEESWE